MGLAEKVKLVESVKKVVSGQSISDRLTKRRAKEIVIALCGAAGSGINVVADAIHREFETKYKYEVVRIKISELIKVHAARVIGDYKTEMLKDSAQRYLVLQDAGNELRRVFGNEILGQLAVQSISLDREKRTLKRTDAGTGADEPATYRVVYLLDSLKHPKEVELLRAVYRNMFYMFGIFCSREKRRENLTKTDIKASDAELIMERDRKQSDPYGQQLMDTLQYADIFINNNPPNIEKLKIDRFIDLILGYTTSPTKDEYAMYMAQSAAMRSGCLSRQIGAAIVNEKGEVISAGYNDVPKKGGGLYCSEDAENDVRCAKKGNECHSDQFKKKITEDIKKVVVDKIENGHIEGIKKVILSKLGNTQTAVDIIGNLEKEERLKNLADDIVEAIASTTRIKDLTEFSRAVHAEMEALVSASRVGMSVQNCSLYCTTFPCHNCAKHIIAAGIKKVYFIEPYEKSLAMRLHGDDIVLEPLTEEVHKKVIFTHFEGVAPRQYINMFQARVQRKLGGRGVEVKPEESLPALPEYLDAWSEVEAKVVEDLKQRLETVP